MKRLIFIAFLSLTALLSMAQPPRVAKPSDIGHDVTTLPRAGYLRPDWDGVNLKFKDANGVLKSLADLVGPISSTVTSSTFTQAVADGLYRKSLVSINWNTDLINRPTDVGAFGNTVNYQTGTQVSNAITAALANRLTQADADNTYRKKTDTQLASTISNFNAAARAALLVSGSGATYNSVTGELVINTGSGGTNYTTAQIRAMFSPGGGLLYDAQNGQFYLKITDVNIYIGNYLRNLDGYAAGKVLAADGNNGFAWLTATTSGTTSGGGSGTTASAQTPYDSILVYADSTRSRFDPSTATVVTLSSVADIKAAMSTSQTNKDFVIANGTYPPGTESFVQGGPHVNVRYRAQTRGGVILQGGSTFSTALLITNSGSRNRVCFEGIKFQGVYNSGGYPLVFSNELVPFDGLEFAYCEFTAGGLGDYNAFNIIQYSGSSNSGALARNFYMHHCYEHDMGRAGNEILCQGYDQVRLQNLVFTYNRFQNLGFNDDHGFGISLSGLIKYVYEAGNVIINAKNIGLEIVNAQYVIQRNNKISGTNTALAGSGVGISDDGVGTTRYVYLENTTTDVLLRPLYIYDSRSVTVTGGTWKGHRDIDMKARNCTFTGMNVLIQSTTVEAGWQFDAPSTGNSLSNSTISSVGSAAAGYNPSYESIVIRSGATNNSFTNVTTILGKKSDGTYWTDGAIVNQGGGTNTISNNTYSLEP